MSIKFTGGWSVRVSGAVHPRGPQLTLAVSAVLLTDRRATAAGRVVAV